MLHVHIKWKKDNIERIDLINKIFSIYREKLNRGNKEMKSYKLYVNDK